MKNSRAPNRLFFVKTALPTLLTENRTAVPMKNNQFQLSIFSGEMPGKTKPQICGIGQPLLDITATVGDGFLNRYGLNSNDSILANEDHTNIFQVCTPY